MTWKSYHRRGEVLATAIAEANTRLDGALPMGLDGVAETFAGELDLVGALHLRWHTRLSGHIDRALSTQPLDLDAAVVAAWVATARELPGVRLVLDRAVDEGIDAEADRLLAVAVAKERMMLAAVAGRASLDDAGSALIGASLEERARAAYAAAPLAVVDARAPRLIDRLRAALAA